MKYIHRENLTYKLTDSVVYCVILYVVPTYLFEDGWIMMQYKLSESAARVYIVNMFKETRRALVRKGWKGPRSPQGCS